MAPSPPGVECKTLNMADKSLHELLSLPPWPHRPRLSCSALIPATLAFLHFFQQKPRFFATPGPLHGCFHGPKHRLLPCLRSSSCYRPQLLPCPMEAWRFCIFTKCGTEFWLLWSFLNFFFPLDHSLQGAICGILHKRSAQLVTLTVVTGLPSLLTHNCYGN